MGIFRNVTLMGTNHVRIEDGTIGIHREKDQWGESFAHKVNGLKIFAMGADYIPEDSLLPRITEKTTRKLLEQCAAAIYNTIRVWGGGYYPDDWFYDICDELGLLVWQDLMFACSTYLLTEEFEENISIEIAENVKRIRHHASLGLWCGNNEMEAFLYDGYGETKRLKADYIKMFSHIIPKIIKKEDPDDFSSLIYASQMMQAEAMKYAVEHWRRHRGQCMGTIVWQLNDCWPVASWSSIDYYGRWKALHYYEKRFFAPIMISCREEGLLSQDPNPNARPYEVEKSIHLNVVNETKEDAEVTVTWSLRNNNSDILVAEHKEVLTIPALSSAWLDKVDLPEARLHQDHVFFSLSWEGEVISEGSVIFSIPKFYHYLDPQLRVSTDGDELIINASAYAKGVEIINEEEDLILSDNYFDMEAGKKRIKILASEALNLRVRSVFDIGERGD